MRGLGDFQRRQMRRGDPRIREAFSQLRRFIDILEDIANHPYQPSETTPPVDPPKLSPTLGPISGPKTEMTQQPAPLLVSIKAAGKLIGVSRTRLYVMINDGSLETVRLGKRRMIRYSSLQKIADTLG